MYHLYNYFPYLRCDECGKYFAQRGSLHTHRSRCKRQDSNHISDICEVCGEQFQFKKQLLAHLQLHEDAKQESDDRELHEMKPDSIKEEIDPEQYSKAFDSKSITEAQSEIKVSQSSSQPDNTKSDSSQQNSISQRIQQDDDEQYTQICENKESTLKRHRKR